MADTLNLEAERARLQAIYDAPTDALERAFKVDVLDGGSQPHEWSDDTVRSCNTFWRIYAMGFKGRASPAAAVPEGTTTDDTYCATLAREAGLPTPRRCQTCGMGPCKKAAKPAVPEGAPPPLLEPKVFVKRSEWHDALTKRQSFNGWRVNYGDCDMHLYTVEQVRDAQRAAVEADRAQRPTDLREQFDAAFLSWNGFHTKAELDAEWAKGTLAGEMFRAGAASRADRAQISLLERQLKAARGAADEHFNTILTLRAELDEAVDRAQQGEPVELDAIFRFLMGESELEGVKFGERHPTKAGAFWWRLNLRAAMHKARGERS